MNDREWYDYLKTNFKPAKGSAYFFNLANCHAIEDLKPIKTQDAYVFKDHIRTATITEFKFAYIDYMDSEMEYFFSKEELEQEENLSTGKIIRFGMKKNLKMDMEQLKKEVAQLILFLRNS